MSDTGGGDGPDATGAGNFTSNVSSSVNLGEVAAQATAFKALSSSIDAVGASLKKLSTDSTKEANTITANLNKISNALGNGGTGGGSGSSNGNYQAQRAQASNASNNTTNGDDGSGSGSSSGGGRSGALSGAAGWLGYQSGEDMVAGLAMAPMRFVRDRIQTNRNVVLGASSALSMAQVNSGGVSQADMLGMLGKNIGHVMGTPTELLQLMQAAPGLGASFGYGNADATGVRGRGFFQGVAQAQSLNPGASMSSLVNAIGGQAANTKAQQQSVMMTGGAMSMIGVGGRQKSLSEWADSTMKWLVDLRPGDKRGKQFSHGELMSQYYPGSNIDAWFDVNGVSQEMRSYWWTYALGKASGSISEDEKGIFKRGSTKGGVFTEDTNNLATLRLKSANALTQGEFALGAGMSGAYGNREQSNRAFNEMIQSFVAQMLPAALKSGPLASIQFMPDMIEDLLYGLLEKSPSKFQTAAGIGFAGSGLLSGLLGDVGDVGDMPGSYGAMGGTTTSGMNLDMRRKLGAMKRANPRITITSGLRDTGLQQSLKKKGHSNVSGKPSAHTRGMAADLGPRSEYGWISANAAKFGLKSGASHGEPWHVGIGDVGDDKLIDSAMDLFGGIFTGKSSGAEGMFDIIGKLFSFLGSPFAGSSGAGPEYEGDLYSRLAAKARSGINIKTSQFAMSEEERLKALGFSDGNFVTDIWGSVTGGIGNLIGGHKDIASAAPAGTQQAGINAAKALFNAGFRDRSGLETMTAISWRESRWNPFAKNPNTSDRGLMQINMSANKNLLQSLGYGEQDLYDIQKNANVARRLYQDAGNSYWPWGMSDAGWSRNGDPLYKTGGSNASAVVDASGVLGDMPDFQYTPMSGAMQVGKNIVFNNTFQIGGGSMGGGNGLDMRRMVTVMADHLEGEMKQRSARSN